MTIPGRLSGVVGGVPRSSGFQASLGDTLPFRTLPSTSFGRARSDEKLATLQREHAASLQHGQELQRWVGDGALHLDLKRKGTYSGQPETRGSCERKSGKKQRHELSSPRLAGPEAPGQCQCHGLAQIAARQIDLPEVASVGARSVGARAWGLRELSLAPARLSRLRVRFCFIPCTRGRGLLAATATLPFGGSLERPVQLRAELQASRFGFGLQISESDPRSSQSSKASAKALTPATSTWPRLSAVSVPLDCKAKAWSASLSFHDASVHRQLAVGLDDLASALLKQLVLLQMELSKLDLLQGLPRSGWAAACCDWLLHAARRNSENAQRKQRPSAAAGASGGAHSVRSPGS